MSGVADFYDEYTERQKEFGINARHRSIMRLLLYHGLKPSDRVLEIGAGIGTQTMLMAEYLKEGTILANDISPKSVQIMEERLKDFPQASFVTGDIVQQSVDGPFDAVVCPDVLEHIPVSDHAALFQMLNKVVSPEGSIYIHIPSPHMEEWMAREAPEMRQVIDQPLYTDELLKNLEGTDFYLYHLESYELFFEPADYQFIVLKKRHKKSFKALNNPGVRLHKRMLNRLKLAGQVLFTGNPEDGKS